MNINERGIEIIRTNVTYASGLCINNPLKPTKEAPKINLNLKGQKSNLSWASDYYTNHDNLEL